jgi:hypothetical protein
MQDTSATAPAAPTKLREPSDAQLQCYIQVIRGQTDMSDDDILVSLKEHNYDMLKVIRSYINGVKSNTTKGDKPADNEKASDDTANTLSSPVIERNVQSVNQMRFNEIRNFMDNAAESFRRTQEMNRIYNQVMEKKKTMAAMAAAATATATATAPQPETNETTQMRSKL